MKRQDKRAIECPAPTICGLNGQVIGATTFYLCIQSIRGNAVTHLSNDDVVRIDPQNGRISLQPLPRWIKATTGISLLLGVGLCVFVLNFEVSQAPAISGYLVLKQPAEKGDRQVSLFNFELRMFVRNCHISEVAVGQRAKASVVHGGSRHEVEGRVSWIGQTPSMDSGIARPPCHIGVDINSFPGGIDNAYAVSAAREMFDGKVILRRRKLFNLPPR
jgi:hypothetical protein